MPPRSLFRQVVAPADVAPSTPPPPADVSAGPPSPPRHTFRLTGECWQVGLAGGELRTLLPSRGAAYIHELFAHPRERISSLELVCRGHRHARRYMLPSGGTKSDGEALAAYRGRSDELLAEMEEARQAGDTEQFDRLRVLMAQLAEEIARVSGLGGKPKAEVTPAEKARQAVTVAIRRARAKIGRYAPDLDAHLDQHLSTGLHPVYEPTAGVEWDL